MPSPRRVPLILSPTPLHRLDMLSKELGVDLWIKRDDLTGFALGGNKGRKLEFLLGDILNSEAEVVVACGASQSNFIRQLGAACSRFGIRCVAAMMDLPYSETAGKPSGARLSQGGNLILDEILGVELVKVPDGPWEQLYSASHELYNQFNKNGLKTYEVPIGGSTPLGAYAFWLAGEELKKQVGQPFDFIVCPTSSGSTHAGLAYSFYGSGTRVVGISCDPEPEIVDDLVRLADGISPLLENEQAYQLNKEDFDFRTDWAGPGYGVPSKKGDLAIKTLARKEGIFLDPIYTGKAFSGLLDLIQTGDLAGRILFWHTGGLPSLFAQPSAE